MATPNQGKLFLKMAAHALLVGLEEIPGAGVAVKIGRGCWKILRSEMPAIF